MFVLLSDEYLILPDGHQKFAAMRLFLRIGRRLPLELQMALAWRTQGSGREIVLSHDFDHAAMLLLSSCPLSSSS